MKTLNHTRKAIETAKQYGGVSAVVALIKGASFADALQNSLMLTWVIALKASLIVKEVAFIDYWMILIIAIPTAYIFSRQIAKALLLVELWASLFGMHIGFAAGLVTFIMSFAGFADIMLEGITSYWDLLLPTNIFKLLTIFVIAAAPISSIKIGITILKHLVGENLQAVNEKEVDLVTKELDDIQAEETKHYKEKKKARIGKKSQGAKSPETYTLEEMRKALNV